MYRAESSASGRDRANLARWIIALGRKGNGNDVKYEVGKVLRLPQELGMGPFITLFPNNFKMPFILNVISGSRNNHYLSVMVTGQEDWKGSKCVISR